MTVDPTRLTTMRPVQKRPHRLLPHPQPLLSTDYAADTVAAQCGVPAEQIRRLAREMAHVAFNETIELPCRWTDIYGNVHDKVVGRPVAFYAMRGISAHANGFQTCRALHLIQMLLGALDGPGNFRSKAPFPRPIPPAQLPENDPGIINAPDTALSKTPLGFPTRPEELALDASGNPLRLDKAYSWEAPLASHGMMHAVIKNAVEGDPCPIDTLILFMANMAWNSAMNTAGTQEMLRARDEAGNRWGNHKIPSSSSPDALTARRCASLIWCCLTRPILSATTRSVFSTARSASLTRRRTRSATRCCRSTAMCGRGRTCWSSWRRALKFPAFVKSRRFAQIAGYTDFIVNYERAPGIGFPRGLPWQGWRKVFRGEPNPQQWQAYIGAQFLRASLARQPALDARRQSRLSAGRRRCRVHPESGAIIAQLYSEPLQKFRLAGQGLYPVGSPPGSRRQRLAVFRSVAGLVRRVPSRRGAASSPDDYPLHAITQRPMMMYHSWDSQNAWLRQIVAQNYLYVNTATAASLGLADLDWVGGIPARQDPLPDEDDGGRRGEHRVDLERHRQDERGLGAGARRVGGDCGLPAQPSDRGKRPR